MFIASVISAKVRENPPRLFAETFFNQFECVLQDFIDLFQLRLAYWGTQVYFIHNYTSFPLAPNEFSD